MESVEKPQDSPLLSENNATNALDSSSDPSLQSNEENPSKEEERNAEESLNPGKRPRRTVSLPKTHPNYQDPNEEKKKNTRERKPRKKKEDEESEAGSESIAVEGEKTEGISSLEGEGGASLEGEEKKEENATSGLRSLYEIQKEMEDGGEETPETENEGDYSDGDSKKKRQYKKRGPKPKGENGEEKPKKSTPRKRKSVEPKDESFDPNASLSIPSDSMEVEEPYNGPTDSLGRKKPPRSRVQKWTVEEDELLKSIVPTMKDISWKKVAERIPGKNENQCFQHWNRVLDPNIKKGPWTPEEEADLERYVEEIKDKSHIWARVAALTEGRIDTQCRYQWGIIEKSRSIPWDPSEENLLLTMVDPHGLVPRVGEAVDWIRLTSKFNSRKQTEVGKQHPVRCSSHVKDKFEALSGKRTVTLFLPQTPKAPRADTPKRSPSLKRVAAAPSLPNELDVNYLSSNAVPQMAPLPPGRHFEQNGAFQEIPGFAAGNMMPNTYQGLTHDSAEQSQAGDSQNQSQGEEQMQEDAPSQDQAASQNANWSETAETAAPFLKFIEMGQQAHQQAQQTAEEQVQEESSGFVAREPVQSLPNPFQNSQQSQGQSQQPQQNTAAGQQGEYDFSLYE
eukprot:TRINITY_DN4256_c3_g3_i1.p1 TRINITY_DN4256_c3_g3~~TRINITY_DN4256_c3_g3_i1.p1  ORF type:complete len:622 (-),score=300.04 TRINITY_DN4256_c3_g3_i1:1032-2897(-)